MVFGAVQFNNMTDLRLFFILAVIIVNQDKLALHWRDLLQIIIYNRCTLEDFDQVLMQDSSW